MKNRGLVWVGALVVSVVVSYFTLSKRDVIKWNDKNVALYNRFGRSWMSFQTSFNPYLKGEKVDETGLDASFKQYEKNVGQAARDIRGDTPPDDEICRRFHGELLKYADLQEEQLKDVAIILALMKAANPGQPEDIQKVAGAFDTLGKKETALQEEIKASQKAMAAKFKFKIK